MDLAFGNNKGIGRVDTTIISLRLDFAGTAVIGIGTTSTAQRTLILGPRYDIGGSGSVSLSDGGTETMQLLGNAIVSMRAPSIQGSVQMADQAGNPYIDFSTTSVQTGVMQIAYGALDLFAASGKAMQFRVDGGTTALKLGSGVGGGGVQVGAPTGGDKGAGSLNLDNALYQDGTQVVSSRRTGWTDQTATASRANLGSSPTVGALASFCGALYDDLKAHGLIGN